MRVVHIGKFFDPFKGGIERVMQDMMLAQTRQGDEVTAIVHHHKPFKPLSVEQREGCNIYRLPIVGNLLFVPLALTAIFHLFRLVNNSRPHILHLHLPNPLCFLLLLSPRCRRIPWIIHWHSDVVGEKPDWRIKILYPIFALFEKALLKHSTEICVTSPNYLTSSIPLSIWKSKCNVLPIALNDSHAAPSDIQIANAADLNILCIGRFTYYKGQTHLIDAVHRLVSANRNVSLTLLGKGEDNPKLEKQVNELGLGHHCTFVTDASDRQVEEILNKCDVLCLPSIERTEAFGVVLLEAMRAAKPCICTSVNGSGMSYVVQHKITGLVVAPENADELAKALTVYHDNPTLQRQHGAAGRARFEQNFEISAALDALNAIYHKALNSSGR